MEILQEGHHHKKGGNYIGYRWETSIYGPFNLSPGKPQGRKQKERQVRKYSQINRGQVEILQHRATHERLA